MKLMLLRFGSAIALVLSIGALVLLWRFRPDQPQLPRSLSSPVTTTQLQQLVLVAAWLLTIVLDLQVLLRAAVSLVAPAPVRSRDAVPDALASSLQRRKAARMGFSSFSNPGVVTPFPLIPRGGLDRIERDGNRRPSHQAEPGPSRPPDRQRTTISLLGPLEIVPSKPSPGYVRALTEELLVYLALHPKGATADDLAAAVLPHITSNRARGRIWRALSEARTELGDVILRSGDHYRLERTTAAVDLDEFDFLLDQAETQHGAARERLLGRALALVRGQPLAGTDYPWAGGDARHLCAKIVSLLHDLGELRIAHGNPTAALAAAEQAIEFDADDEPAHRLAMRAESALGLREAVVQRYERLSRGLDKRLGLEPEQETRRLYRRLLSQDPTDAETTRVSG